MRKVMAGAAALALLAAGLGPVDPAYAKSNKNNSWSKLEAELTAVDPTLDPAPEGEARSEAKTHKGSLQLNRFRGKVEIPIPFAGLLPDLTTNVVEMFLTTLGGSYTCTLGLHKVEFQGGVASEAEFKVDARLVPKHGGPVVKSKYGTCVMPPATDPVVPVVEDGDTITVNLNGVLILTGTLLVD